MSSPSENNGFSDFKMMLFLIFIISLLIYFINTLFKKYVIRYK